MINKEFLYQDEKWIVEEVLTYGYKCSCRNLDTDETKIFNVDFVQQRINSYQDDLKDREKRYNAFHFEENDEKDMLIYLVKSFCETDLSELDIEDLIALKKIKKRMNIK